MRAQGNADNGKQAHWSLLCTQQSKQSKEVIRNTFWLVYYRRNTNYSQILLGRKWFAELVKEANSDSINLYWHSGICPLTSFPRNSHANSPELTGNTFTYPAFTYNNLWKGYTKESEQTGCDG